jgi:hypothetical protein
LRVETEDGQRLVFRYFDPRVLRVFLPVCTPAEKNDFFGPVYRFFIEGRTIETMHVHARDGSSFADTRVDLDAGG